MPEPTKVFFKDLDFDPDNPNQMSEEQELGMDSMLSKFGFLENIIVQPKNDEGRQLIHHGEHRVRRLMKAGNEWAWGVERTLTPEEHRLLRQGMNKLHGTHDAEMDKKEYKILEEAGQLEQLAILIAQPKEQLMVEKDIMPTIEKDAPMLQHHKDTFEHGNLKQLMFIFDNEGYEAIMERLDVIKKEMNPETNTDLFLMLVENYENNNIKKT